MRSPVAYVLVCLLAAGCAAPPANQDRVSLIRSANDELLHKGNGAAAREIFTPDYVAHLTDGDLSGGPEVIENFVTELRTAFPDEGRG